MPTKFTDRYRFDFSNFHIDGNNREGYFARCYRCIDTSSNKYVAIKYLRHELPHPKTGALVAPFELHYDAFCREAEFLKLLSSASRNEDGVAWVPTLFNMGYLTGLVATKENANPTEAEFEEIKTIKEFRKELKERMKDGWRPYLSIEYFPVEKNVQQIHEFYVGLFPKLSISRSNETVYPHMPLLQTLVFTIQVARLFKIIHRNPTDQGGPIFYPDSKLPHFFWNGRQSAMIDWNRVWYFDERGKDEYVYPVLSEEIDIQHFVSVPLFALLTGRDPAGKQPFFGSDAKPPNFDDELKIIQQGYSDGIYQLFKDVLTSDGSIKDAITLENRCELLLEELFNFSATSNKQNDYKKIQTVLENLNQANALVEESWEIIMDDLLLSGISDVNYIYSILDYIRERNVTPWTNVDRFKTDF